MWVKDSGTSDLTGVATSGGLPTLSQGEYTGVLVSAYKDVSDKQWVTLTCSHGSHVEQCDLDLSELEVGGKVKFVIKAMDGAGLAIKGQKYQLLAADRKTSLTGWTGLDEIYKFIQDNNVELAGPRIAEIASNV